MALKFDDETMRAFTLLGALTSSNSKKRARAKCATYELDEYNRQQEINFDADIGKPCTAEEEDYLIRDLSEKSIRIVDKDKYVKRINEPGHRSVLQAFVDLAKPKYLHVASNHFLSMLDSLRVEFPNFSEVVDEIKAFATASMITDTPFYFPPTLLVGPPGIGKSEFMSKFSQYAELPFKVLNMSGDRDVLKLKGTSPHWGNSQPSELVKFMSNIDVANPLVMIDELDKAGGKDKSENVQETLLTLTERSTSKQFEDAFIGSPTINLSHLIYIATANDLSRIDETLLSRFLVFKIENLSREQRSDIIRQIYRVIHDEYKAEDYVERRMDDEVCEYLADMDISLREVKRILNRSLCRTLSRYKDTKLNFEIGDITGGYKKEPERRTIGFI